MNEVCRNIFKAIHEGKWLDIEYRNSNGVVTRYWIAIKELHPRQKQLIVEGLHLSRYSIRELTVRIDAILSSAVIDGSYFKTNQELIDDIKRNPHRYQGIFGRVANLKVLHYLSDCNKMDVTPYQCEYSLIRHIDGDSFANGAYRLSESQFQEIVSHFHYQSKDKTLSKKIKRLALNVLSVHTKKGLYVLAYRRLDLDVMSRTLKPAKEITVCREFTIDGEKQSVRRFLDAEDYHLLDEFEQNQETIKDCITNFKPHIKGVDDVPYVMAVGMDVMLDLEREYAAIMDMYDNDDVTFPIRAFFGDLLKRPDRRKEHPITLLNERVNIDQLLAIHNAMKYPIAYIQGPPGTGKTNTIINTIVTAFFNERTVLLTSYNNHPIDGAFEALSGVRYRGERIPFPIIRIGNNDKVSKAMEYVKDLYERTKRVPISEAALERDRSDKIQRTKRLTALLRKHEEILDLYERKETIEKLLESNHHLTFQSELHGRHLYQVNQRLMEMDRVTDEDVRNLVMDGEEEFAGYLYHYSVTCIRRLDEPKNKDFLSIVQLEDKESQIVEFNRYLGKEENVKKFLRIFPIVATTCLSAHKIGEPKPYFDMTVIDEASQCNTAVSLVPIIRGRNLMMVGDPQQLSPVIVLDEKDNLTLKRKYSVPNEYDYRKNSIYKTYLACDAVSDEVLLSYHYRCHKRIIEFNNKKYYNNKLNVKSKVPSERPLMYVDVTDDHAVAKNASLAEAFRIVEYAKRNKDKRIGVITPFVNQKECIRSLLHKHDLDRVTCGTVHAFQGDEKDVILFSLALTDQTHPKTYQWLKNNKELINVATSRAKEQLIVLCDGKNLTRLHAGEPDDDVFELVQYVKSNGVSKVTGRVNESRALGVKPYSTETEEAFLTSLNHALDNVFYHNRKCVVYKEVSIAHVFRENAPYRDLFYTGRFDFVVYEKTMDKREIPVFAIELDGKEHVEDEIVKERDRIKNEICQKHGFELIRIENSYARRYQYIKDILIKYFTKHKATYM